MPGHMKIYARGWTEHPRDMSYDSQITQQIIKKIDYHSSCHETLSTSHGALIHTKIFELLCRISHFNGYAMDQKYKWQENNIF